MKRSQVQKEKDLLAALDQGADQTIKDRGGADADEKIDLFGAPNTKKRSNRQNYQAYNSASHTGDMDDVGDVASSFDKSSKQSGNQQFFDVMSSQAPQQEEERRIQVTLVRDGDNTVQPVSKSNDPFGADIGDQIDDDPFGNKPNRVPPMSSNLRIVKQQDVDTKADSLANYQAGLSQKAANRKKQLQKEAKDSEKSTSHVDNLLAKAAGKTGAHKAIHNEIFEDDIGEVGEWIGKSAAVKGRDSDDEEPEAKDDDFDAIFDGDGPNKPNAITQKQQHSAPNPQLAEGSSNSNGIKAERVNLNANYRVVKKGQGQFQNSLAEKAKAIAEDKQIQQQKQKGEQEAATSNEPPKKKPVFISPEEFEEDNEEAEKSKAESLEDDLPVMINGYPSPDGKENADAEQHISKLDAESFREEDVDVKNKNDNEFDGKVLEAMNDEEWDEISKKNLAKAKNKQQNEDKRKLVDFASAWNVVRNLNLAPQKRQVASQTVKKGGFLSKIFAGCSASKLPANLASERDQILAFAKVPYIEDEELHYDMLRTIFIKLTDNYNCPRYGPHWEMIGFQGRDPASDLRSVGMLGVLQILAFLSSHFEIMKEAFTFSLKDKKNPPLCSCMLGITLIVMDLVRDGKLNGQINSQRSAINAINNMYFAIYYKLYSAYRVKDNPIQDYPILLREVTESAKRNPSRILQDFLSNLENGRAFGN